MQVRPTWSTASLRVSPPPARDHTRSVGRHRPAPRTLTLSQAYGAQKYERLQALKRKYDPDNFFRRNQNIPPK